MIDPPPSSHSCPIRFDGSDLEAALYGSDLLTQNELLNHRSRRRVKQLNRIYRNHALMQELKLKHREYYWEYGKSAFIDAEETERSNFSGVDCSVNEKLGGDGGKSHGDEVLPHADTRRAVSPLKGPIVCGKPMLRSTILSHCSPHFQKAEKFMVRALKNTGLNISFTSKLTPKFHVIIAEYVHQIQIKRRVAENGNLENF